MSKTEANYKVVLKKVTLFTMNSKMTKENEKALKIVSAIKGLFD